MSPMVETAAQSGREEKALKVLQLVNQGMAVRKACHQVGISKSAFYQFYKDRPEFVQATQKRLVGTSQDLLFGILVSRVELLYKVINDALKDETRPMERLAIFKETERLLQQLEITLRLDMRANAEAAQEVLSGPNLTPGESRYSATKPEETD